MGMTGQIFSIFRGLGLFFRSSVAALLAGLLLGWTREDIDNRFAECPVGEQIALVGGMIAVMILLSLMFAEAGAVGLFAFWLSAILIAR